MKTVPTAPPSGNLSPVAAAAVAALRLLHPSSRDEAATLLTMWHDQDRLHIADREWVLDQFGGKR